MICGCHSVADRCVLFLAYGAAPAAVAWHTIIALVNLCKCWNFRQALLGSCAAARLFE